MEKTYKTSVLIIRDGWGENKDPRFDAYNAVKLAQTPCADQLTQSWPRTEIEAAGLAVGLPEGIMGNSEVGHQNMGAGRVVDQEIVRINKSIASGAVAELPSLQSAMAHVQQQGSALHLMGLVSDAGVHAMLDHLFGLVKVAKAAGVQTLYLHAFTDGRDTGPFTGLGFIQQVEAEFAQMGIGQIASVSGRYWAMDRDQRWDRVQRAYDCLTGRAIERTATSAAVAIQAQYDQPETAGTQGDEFCPPTAIVDAQGVAIGTIQSGDAVLFYNFRGDRPRELTRAFIDSDFDSFDRGPCLDLHFCTMTEYQKGLCDRVVFTKPEPMESILGAYLSQQGIPQFRCAETEKFPHVTFFFNDYREAPFPGEERCLIPSRKDCATYDEKPEMSAYGIRDAAVQAIRSGKYGLVVVNFANPDMVGHTGVVSACVRACEIVDSCVADLLQAVDAIGGNALITADHGNCDQLWNFDNDGPHTAHTLNPVEVVLYGESLKEVELHEQGCLGDIAPTLLAMMHVEQPQAMTGRSLIRA
jgi:2,3-bisphosphoglycerate-independent phosphoglycerate mutase